MVVRLLRRRQCLSALVFNVPKFLWPWSVPLCFLQSACFFCSMKKKKKGGGSSSTQMTVPIGTSIRCRKCFCQLCSVALCFEARASSARLQKKKKKKKLTLSRKIRWHECVNAMCEAGSVRGMRDCGSVMGNSNQREKIAFIAASPTKGSPRRTRPDRRDSQRGRGGAGYQSCQTLHR